jgi:hypothetical protein
MIAIPLGKIAVPTPGTPLALTLSGPQLAKLTPSGQVRKIEAWADPADTGKVFVVYGGVKIAGLPAPSGGFAASWSTPDAPGNTVNPLDFAVDAATATQGPFVTLWVE